MLLEDRINRLLQPQQLSASAANHKTMATTTTGHVSLTAPRDLLSDKHLDITGGKQVLCIILIINSSPNNNNGIGDCLIVHSTMKVHCESTCF